jgi:signal transduction histidine kinase
VARRLSPTLKAVSDAVLGVTVELSVEEVLQRLVHGARDLASARYAALGLPDGDGGFRRFLTSGMSDDLIASFGPLPRQHGVLGAMLELRTPYRSADIHEHPRFRGWWPDRHPDMRSFLGVPIVAPEGVIGAFYLTEKVGSSDFSDEDEELIVLLAAHAAIAITNARLYEQSRELSIVAERNRLALDLHDVVSQKLFGLLLTAEAATTLFDRDPAGAREQVAKLRGLAREALAELRSLIFELRPPELEQEGLCGALRKHVDVLRRVHQCEIDFDAKDELPFDAQRDPEVLRLAQEALQNVLKHANAQRVAVRIRGGGSGLLLEVEDDGIGFDRAASPVRSRSLGLTSMEERAKRVGGRLDIHSAPGAGTIVRLEVSAD